MSFSLRNLNRLGNQFSIPIDTDEAGCIGRECPIEDCLGYFKVAPGTGVQGSSLCYCPYCGGHSGENYTFFTQEQIEYAKSIMLRQVTDAIFKDMKSMEFDHKPRGGFGIGLSLKVKRDRPHPIHYYREKELETDVICESCTLRYAIYGVFGWCPDCGVHNSMQMLIKNLELSRKELALAESAEKELAEHLVCDALKNAVSAFDGFGRQICAQKGRDVRFQNLPGARRKVLETFKFDFADQMTTDEWEALCRTFQKRHLLSHKMGVIDEDYVQRAIDPGAIVGRKVRVAEEEVENSIKMVEALGKRLFAGILSTA